MSLKTCRKKLFWKRSEKSSVLLHMYNASINNVQNMNSVLIIIKMYIELNGIIWQYEEVPE